MKNKNTLLKLSLLAGILAMGCFTQGCAHFSKTASTTHVRTLRSAALPPGWSLVQVGDSLNLPDSETTSFLEFNAAATNCVAGFFAPRPVVFDSITETWTDTSKGGGTFLFTDPNASQVASSVNNQAALAGSHSFSVGAIASVTTSNNVSMMNAVGSAAGNVIGAAAKAAAGKP